MTIIGSLRSYFQAFPGLQRERLDIDCLAHEVDRFSIDAVPCEPVLQSYLDGGTVRQYLFTISSRFYFGTDLAQQERNLVFVEDLERWLEEQQFFRRMPDLGPGRTPRHLEITNSAYPYLISDSGKARYQIQLRLEYYQEVTYHEAQ